MLTPPVNNIQLNIKEPSVIKSLSTLSPTYSLPSASTTSLSLPETYKASNAIVATNASVAVAEEIASEAAASAAASEAVSSEAVASEAVASEAVASEEAASEPYSLSFGPDEDLSQRSL